MYSLKYHRQTFFIFSGASCEADIFHNMPRQNIVPIVVAACLAGIILVIIIAYFVSKNIGQSAYRPME